jgi:phage tail sheath protein FI
VEQAGVDTLTGKRKGMKAFEDCYSLFGYFPKTIIAPVFCEETAVVSQMKAICDKIRAIGLVDAPIGTTVQEAITGRGPEGTINFNTSSDRVILCYPHLKVYDSELDTNILQPYSQRLAGVIAAKDVNKGYHWSPSNTETRAVRIENSNNSCFV